MQNLFIKEKKISRNAIRLCALALFFVNLLGFFVFRLSVSDDLFGGDVYSFTRNTHSYFLTYRDILNPAAFFSNLFSGKNEDPGRNPNAFVWGHLSDQGRSALERLSSGKGSEWDQDLFMIDINKSIVDLPVKWPEHFLKNAKGIGIQKPGISNQEYNVRVLAALFPQISVPTYLNKIGLRALAVNTWGYLPHLFTQKQATRYAPLSGLYTTTLCNYLRNNSGKIMNAILVQSLIYALLMTLVFFLALEVSLTIPWAVLAVLLFQTAVATILSTYTIFSLPYFFVPLVMVAAFLSYLRYKSSGHIGYLLGFICLSVAGPWFREFAGLIPFIVFANEILNFKGRRSLFMMVLCVLLGAHSMYPSFLTWIIGLNKGDFFSVYAQSNRQQLVTSVWNWMAPGMLFVEIPPLLWLIAWGGMAFWILRSDLSEGMGQPAILGMRLDLTFLHRPMIGTILKVVAGISMILVPVFVGYHFFGRYQDPGWQHPGMGAPLGRSILALILALALFSLRVNTLIPIYFLAVFLPFLRIGGNTEVHLSFALAPLSIMILFWIRRLHQMLARQAQGFFKGVCLTIFSLLFAVGMIDQAANVWACVSSQRAVVRVNKEMASWIRANLERHSVIVFNFFNFYDVFHYSNYHFDPYETVENCPMGPGNVVHADKDFDRLAEKYFPLAPFYFLANQIQYYDYQKDYHAHKYVKNPPGELEELRRFKVKNTYYYFDPLKFFIMRRFQTLPLYMDWSIDFYYHNTGSVFQRVVSADYTLYRLKNLSKNSRPPEKPLEALPAPPTLVTGHKKHNIVYYNNIFYAVPQSLGPLDLASEADRTRPGILSGDSGEEVQKLIDEMVVADVQENVAETPEPIGPPTLVIGYKNYNIVYYDNIFYAVPQSLGPLDLASEADRTRPGILSGDSGEEVQKLIDETVVADIQKNAAEMLEPIGPPTLVIGYKNYNIVYYNNIFYAVPQSLGPLDLTRGKDRALPGIFIKNTREEIQKLIDEITAATPVTLGPPRLVKRHKRYNVVLYGDLFYALPQSLGPLDLANEVDRSRPGILTGNSGEEVRRLIDEAVATAAQKTSGRMDTQTLNSSGSPMLVTDYKGYNIVFYRNIFYGVPQSLGPMDLAIEANQTRTGIVTGSSVRKAKMNIDKAQRNEMLNRFRRFLAQIISFFLVCLHRAMLPFVRFF